MSKKRSKCDVGQMGDEYSWLQCARIGKAIRKMIRTALGKTGEAPQSIVIKATASHFGDWFVEVFVHTADCPEESFTSEDPPQPQLIFRLDEEAFPSNRVFRSPADCRGVS